MWRRLKKGNTLDTLAVLMLKVIGVAFLFGTTFFLTNNFDASLVGQYDFTRAVLLIFGGLTVLGMNQSIVYYAGFFKAKNNLSALKKVYFNMLSIVICVAIAVSILYLILPESWLKMLFQDEITRSLIGKTIISLGFFAIMQLSFDALRGLGLIKTSEIFKNILRYVPFFLAIIYISSINQEDYLVDVFLLNFVLLAVISFLFVIYQLKGFKSKKENLQISKKDIINRSYPMAISFIAYILLQSTDIILLSHLESYEMTAYYAVAVKIATGLSLVLLSVNTVIAPQIAQYFEEQQWKKINQIISKSTRLIFILTLPGVLILIFFGEYILSLFGEAYTQSFWALMLLLIGQVVNAGFGPVGTYMNMTGKQRKLQLILIFAVILNIVLNLLLIPVYGIEGAAIATATTTILWNITASGYVYKKEKVKTFLN
ncbi:MAG: polysaccharide biosynthesis C-terminal domain-containing protein [Flavobacteriaceae bacterium]|nr:polysaccharide biosynthesis C-terminal domain-containing protein [Flavobacteriaceae bacterium]